MTLLNAIEKIAIEDQKRLVESNNVKRDMELQAKTDEVGKAKHDKAMAELDAKRAQLESVKLALKAKEKADEIAAMMLAQVLETRMDTSPLSTWIDQKSWDKLVSEHLLFKQDHGYLIWGLLTLHEWCQRLEVERVKS